MVHLRVVAPREQAEKAHALLAENPLACHLVYLKDVVEAPDGDLILVDVPREEASVIVGDLKNLGIPETGSISVAPIDVQLSDLAEKAERESPGAPADAVVWEEVEARTSEESRLSISYLAFMVLAALIAGVGILENSAILIIGGMVVGPEFGPIAAFCVAAVERRGRLALRSLLALVIGFPLAITSVWLSVLVFRAVGVAPDSFSEADHSLASTISNPDVLSFFIAFCAGMAGVLSLSTAKSGALIGVLVSVTTIPAAANIAIAFAYQDWASWRGSQGQLALNISGILLAGTLTLWIQRLVYRARRIEHLKEHQGVERGASEPSPATTTPRASSAPAAPRRP
jgi:uncharacterized hydrophobic protein (TIGR00271 family)